MENLKEVNNNQLVMSKVQLILEVAMLIIIVISLGAAYG